MAVDKLIKDTRSRLKLSVRQFAPMLYRSGALVNRWELGLSTPDFTDMYYAYTHATNAEVKEMAAAVMKELDPVRAAGDLEPVTITETTNTSP